MTTKKTAKKPIKKTTRQSSVYRTHLHRRIFTQLVLFIIIAIVMFGVVIYDVIRLGASPWSVVVGAAIGSIVGYIVGRAFKVKWHEDTRKIVMGVDRLGVLLIIVYIAFRYFSSQVFGHFVHGESLTALIYSTLAGIMVGRVISLRGRIQKILKSKNLI